VLCVCVVCGTCVCCVCVLCVCVCCVWVLPAILWCLEADPGTPWYSKRQTDRKSCCCRFLPIRRFIEWWRRALRLAKHSTNTRGPNYVSIHIHLTRTLAMALTLTLPPTLPSLSTIKETTLSLTQATTMAAEALLTAINVGPGVCVDGLEKVLEHARQQTCMGVWPCAC